NANYIQEQKDKLDLLILEKDKRIDAISIRENDDIDMLNKQISELQNSISELKNKKIRDVITRKNIDNIF
ncbi:hypothetical protein, partial [Escherichia coli]|uniref:hypothetical protein n=1 Tax=Escherichia coli TaxID=562 RepID=UPI0019D6C3E3